MRLSSPAFDSAHALKCELAREVLETSGTLRLQVTGWSMLPSIWPGDTLLIERASYEMVSDGDIVLFSRDGRLFAHRVVSMQTAAAGTITTRGDAMPQADSPVSSQDLLGKVSFILRNGQRIQPSRKLGVSRRAIAALASSSEIAARVVVGVQGMRHAINSTS